MGKYIKFETAKLAKEKGFDVDNKIYFLPNGKMDSILGLKVDGIKKSDCFLAPTQSELQEWLREIHKIDIYIRGYEFGYYPSLNNVPPNNQGSVKYIDRRWNLMNQEGFDYLHKYEDALEVGLRQALKLI